jgi:RimJ/RimL family protein N-acetyltransferase
MTLVLETARLAVRQLGPGDAAALHEVCGDPRTMALVGDGSTLDLAGCARWIATSQRHYAARGYGAFGLWVRGTDALAGYGGIAPAPRRSDPELIYALRPEWWGQGLASELLPPLIAFGLAACGLPRLVATVRPDNRASRRVLEKSGLHCTGEEVDGEGLRLLVYVVEGVG